MLELQMPLVKVVTCVLVVPIAAALSAAEPTPTPTPTPTATAVPVTPTPQAPDKQGSAADAEAQATPGAEPKPTSLVVTNANLKEIAKEGRLTEPNKRTSDDFALRSPRASEGVFAKERQQTAEASDEAQKQGRDYWRSKYRQQLEKINGLERRIERLTKSINQLQNQFYATDDPAYRDGVIKVNWDQAIADREAAREALSEARAELPTIVGEARSQGAQPGWFRGLSKESVAPDSTDDDP
jgi:hypothetical protein